MSDATTTGWSTAGDAVRLWFAPSTLRKTLKIAAAVCIVLCVINIGLHLSVPVRVLMNFLVPFCVSSIGVLSATRRRQPEE